MRLQSDDAHAPYTTMGEGEASSSFGRPVFPPLVEVKLGAVKKSWVTTTFYETVVTVEVASKLLCLPKQSHRRVIPKHLFSAVAFTHGTNLGDVTLLCGEPSDRLGRTLPGVHVFGLQYCIVHSVTFYEARKPLGTGCFAMCWKYCRALKGYLMCQRDNYVEAHIPISTITLSSEPPVEDIMAYVYGTMSSSTVDKVNTIARLQADGIIATLDSVDGLHV